MYGAESEKTTVSRATSSMLQSSGRARMYIPTVDASEVSFSFALGVLARVPDPAVYR